MALVKCVECDKEISTTAKHCPHCGAVIKRSLFLTWVVVVLLVAGLLGILPMLSYENKPIISQACKPIDKASFWLPHDKEFAKADFFSKAERLRASGLCVFEGGFGTLDDKYYITVSKTGDAKNAEILHFSYEELSL